MKVNGASEEIGSDGPGIFALWFGEFYSIGGKAGLPVVYLHIKPEVAGVSRPYCRCKRCSDLSKATRVNTSLHFSSLRNQSQLAQGTPGQDRDSCESFSDSLVSTDVHTACYLFIIQLFLFLLIHAGQWTLQKCPSFASFACCTFTRTPPFSQHGCKQRAKHASSFFFQQVYQVSGQ